MPIFTHMQAVLVVHNAETTIFAEMVPTLVGRDVTTHSFGDMVAALALAAAIF